MLPESGLLRDEEPELNHRRGERGDGPRVSGENEFLGEIVPGRVLVQPPLLGNQSRGPGQSAAGSPGTELGEWIS